MSAPEWFVKRLGWKQATEKASARCQKYFGVDRGPNLADLSGASSTRIAGEAYRILGIPTDHKVKFDLGSLEAAKNKAAQTGNGDTEVPPSKIPAAGAQLEQDLASDIERSLYQRTPDVDPSSPLRRWLVTRQGDVSQFTQYQHLADLQKLLEDQPVLRTTVGRDYQVTTDVMIGAPSQWAGTNPYMLHAAVSSKLTIRSDRAQNIRVEFGTLVRNRRGRLPHLVVVTAEPLPSRVISIARGTGEIDAIYHLMYHELDSALEALKGESKTLQGQWADWREMIEMGRVRPYDELADVLVAG
jgi:hypothetical protein